MINPHLLAFQQEHGAVSLEDTGNPDPNPRTRARTRTRTRT